MYPKSSLLALGTSLVLDEVVTGQSGSGYKLQFAGEIHFSEHMTIPFVLQVGPGVERTTAHSIQCAFCACLCASVQVCWEGNGCLCVCVVGARLYPEFLSILHGGRDTVRTREGAL